MRSREEIEREAEGQFSEGHEDRLGLAILEVLLDIRELLKKKPSRPSFQQPEPPKV